MILNVIKAEYLGEYKLLLGFNNGESFPVDLKDTIFHDTRNIFKPLQDVNYFRSFRISLNTVTWPNEADFAPEFLYDLALKHMAIATK